MASDFELSTLELFGEMTTNFGNNVLELSKSSPVLLIFLRHFGCAFCRASLADLSKKKAGFTRKGIKMVFVHMTDHVTADTYFDQFNLNGAEHVSDPDCRYYANFGIVKGTIAQLFGFTSLMKGFSYSLKKGQGYGRIVGDGFQMPGVFLTHEGIVKEQFIHKEISDKPDYDKLVSCCVAI